MEVVGVAGRWSCAFYSRLDREIRYDVRFSASRLLLLQLAMTLTARKPSIVGL
jgi:hypothetical protein